MNKGMYVAFLSTVFIGLSIVVGSQAAKTVNPLVLAAYANLLSVVFLLAALFVFRVKIDARKMIRKYPKDFAATVVSRPLLGSLLLSIGWSITPAIRAVFLDRLEPLFVILVGYILLRKKVTRKAVFFSFVLLFGAYLFLTNAADIFTSIGLGDIIIIYALIPFSYSYITSARILKEFSPLSLAVVMNFFAGIILLAAAALIMPNNLIIGTGSVNLIILQVLLFEVIGLTMWLYALKNIDGWIVSSILSLNPISGSILAFFWLGDTMAPLQIIGGSLIILMAILIARQDKIKVPSKRIITR